MRENEKYVNVADLKRKLRYWCKSRGMSKQGVESLTETVGRLPYTLKGKLETTLETEPKKHGKWEFHANFVGNYYTCTVCKNVAREMPECMGEPTYEFCPYCGARMDGGDENA